MKVGVFVLKKGIAYCLGAIGVILSIVLIVWLCKPVEKNLVVNELYWEYNQTIETLETFYGEGWDYPIGARVYEVSWEYYDTEEILIGYDEDGYPIYEYEEIYAEYYYYEYDEWCVTREVVTHGTIDEKPYWGNIDCYYGERLGMAYETYTASVTENRKSKYYEVSYRDWIRLKRGEVNHVKTSLGHIVEVY